ncbi:DUF7562 family protein [Halorientalis salina]|uniref:DUF7562 family protein n=1 Tax=Halorientalis salina TaxID=2932266 RepID=UPI0010AD57FD|nr:hypothetical protein [Halorientalis salina]
MWGSRRTRDGSQVTCIACGSSIARSDAREYDKHGDRWEREDKEFEFLCKGCHRGLCHQPRQGLESLLIESSAGERDRDAFLAKYHELVSDRRDSPPES